MPSYQITKLRFLQPLQFAINVTLKYKYYLDDSYTTVVTNLLTATDGTLSAPQTISGLEYNKRYTLQCTNEQCETIYEEDIIYPCQSGCPNGYTASPDNTYCYKVLVQAATPPVGTPDTLIAQSAIQYSTCGSYIYNSGFNVNGTGTSTQITTANAFWVNGAGTCADNNDTDGPLNRCGVWASSTSANQDIGFSVCINITEEKTYYIGIGCDNYGSIKVDGVAVVTQNESAINAQYSITGACFKVFHIYPVHLTAGIHFIELFGHNVASIAGFGAEIYDNTSAEIIAATDYADLNLIFSTKDEIGAHVILGTGGYSCAAGYALAACESPYVCKKIVTADFQC